MNASDLEAGLRAFTGTEHYYRHWTNALVYTDGVRYLAESAGAYWLIDEIAFLQKKTLKFARLREFQLWELHVKHSVGTVVCSLDWGVEAFRRTIPFTDLCLNYLSMYVENGVLLLPSEH